jgi:hypothetical protein
MGKKEKFAQLVGSHIFMYAEPQQMGSNYPSPRPVCICSIAIGRYVGRHQGIREVLDSIGMYVGR